MTAFVVRWHCNIYELETGISVTECNDRAVSLGTLHNSLAVGSRVGDDDQSRLDEVSGLVVGQSTWDPSSGLARTSGVLAELEYSSLTVWSL